MDVVRLAGVCDRCSEALRISKRAVQPLKGFRELSPEDFVKKKKIVERSRELFRLYGYEEVEIPTVEPSALIELKSGEEIRHRMFRFKDLGGRGVVLRPEGTPSVARYVVTKLKGKPLPVRLSYVANMFRYDEPQRGRFREFTHVGFELFGSSNPLADMEILEITSVLLSGLGFVDFEAKIGDQGTLRAVLAKFGIRGSLQDRLLGMIDRNEEKEISRALRKGRPGLAKLMKELTSVRENDVEKAFDKADNLVRGIPEAVQSLARFRELVNYANAVTGGKVMVDFGFARGIEYYTGMVFEVYVKGLNVAVAGGGRYDDLCSLFGADIPAVGVAVGVDRLALGDEFPKIELSPPVAIVLLLDQGLIEYGASVARELRSNGVPTLFDLSTGSLSSRLEKAAKRQSRFAVLIGQRETKDRTVTVKDLATGMQQLLPFDGVSQFVRQELSSVRPRKGSGPGGI